jgi:hypothetical protein
MPRWAWPITSAQGRASEVGQLLAPEVGPQALYRIELGRLGGQPLDHQPGPLGVQIGPHGSAAVGGQAIPQQAGLLATKEPVQLRKDLNQRTSIKVSVSSLPAWTWKTSWAPPPRTP